MRHFTFTEFERSATATKHAIDNTAPEAVMRNIAALVDAVLDPLREAWGAPITVSSGYRCPALNPLVGGAKNSQHLTGEAADLRVFVRDKYGRLVRDAKGNAIVDKTGNRRLFQLIQEMQLPFDQLIDEKDFSWVHVSHKANGINRKEVKKL